MESCPTQAVFPLVGLAADKVIRDRHGGGKRRRYPEGEKEFSGGGEAATAGVGRESATLLQN
ncbi:MAG: hypothetical protein ACQESR_10615 [Planctomycetota bacterium]